MTCQKRIFFIFSIFASNTLIKLLFLFQLTAEHEHSLRILEITKDNQNALAAELADAKV